MISNCKNVKIYGGNFTMNNGPAVINNNDNSQHITKHGPVSNNYDRQTINQAPTYNNGPNSYNSHNFNGPSAVFPMADQTRFPQGQSSPNHYFPGNSQSLPNINNPRHQEPTASLMGADYFQTNSIDLSQFRSHTHDKGKGPLTEPLQRARNPHERIVHFFGNSGSYATVENPVIHGMTPEFQRRFESLMDMVPQAAKPEEGDGSEGNDDLNTADQAPNTRNSMPHASRHMRSRRGPYPGSSVDVEMRDSSQDLSSNSSSARPEGSSSNFEDSPVSSVNANPPPPSTHYHIDNRVYTTNINSGNVNTENTYDSFNDNSTRTEVHKQIG